MTAFPEDIELMANYLGREDPAICRLLKAYTSDPKMADTVCSLLKRRCLKAGFNPDDPPVFLPVRNLPNGTINVGQVLQGTLPGPQFALPEKVITQHLGIFGHNGTGKSFLAMDLALQAIRAGLTVWIFDIEDEYRRLIPLLPDGTLVALEPEQLRINFFQPPGEWCSPASWLDELNLLLRGSTFLRDGSLNIFHTGMNRLLERNGIAAGGANWPSLCEVIEYFQGLGFGPKTRSAGFIESLLNRLVTLADFFSKTAAVKNSNMLENLAQKSVVFRLHGLVGIPLQSLVSFLLLWLARFREGAPLDKPHVIIIEEPHMLASEKARQDIGESVLCRMFRTARKRGIALILCDQVPSELPPAILGNLACRIVMRLTNARCIWSIQSSMSLERKQVEAIAALQPRRAVVQYTLLPTPFMIEVPQMDFPAKPQGTSLLKHTGELLSKTQFSYYDGKSERVTATKAKILAPDDLTGDTLLVMVRICEEPAELIEQRCSVLRMDRAKEFRARAELDARGLIAQVEQTIAGKTKFFQPTDKGIAWAQKRNIHVKKFKSGIIHEYILCQVEKRIGLIGPQWRLQRNSSVARDKGLQPDLLVMEPGGKRIIVEICCNNFDYDTKNILSEATIPEIDRVVAVTPDNKAKQSLEEALKKNSHGLNGNQQKSVVLLDAGECLADQFNWTAVLVHHGQKVQEETSLWKTR